MSKKGILLSVIALLVLLFFALDLSQWLTLAQLKASQQQLVAWQAASPWLFALLFGALYIISTALSLPGATVLTLAAGALFGLFHGLILVSFASSIGATLAFLAARYVLRDSVQQRFGHRLQVLNDGVARDGAFYLFTLRLVPLFPFFLINLLMGLTPMRARTFYWVSQLGMLAGTIVYVNAGTQLAKIDSLSGILSPALLLSFVLLGLFPLLARAVLQRIQRQRVYRGWAKPARFDRNLIVIGAGAAGLVSSYIAAAVKAKVTLIEAHKMGGDCLNYGCVPSKALIASAKAAQQLRDANHYGLESTTPRVNFRAVMARIHAVIRTIEPHDSIERYTQLGVEVIQGYARLIDPWTVEITLPDGGTQHLSARSIILATGARPAIPPLPGLDEVGYLTSDTLWDTLANRDDIPRRMVILGGGPIGCELAQSFARLGAHVTQIEQAPRLLLREDEDVSALVAERLAAEGVQVLTSHRALHCQHQNGEKSITVEHKGEQLTIAFDELIVAVGRQARLGGFGLETLGIQTNRTVETNDYLETLFPHIYAAGDVAGPYQLTHAAAHQAWYATVNALFGQWKRFRVDYRVLPAVTFVEPEVARVGLNEQEAKAQGIAYELTRYDLDDLDRAIADGHTAGFVKVLTVPGKDRILGVSIVGAHAGELLAEYVLAMKHGLGLNKILGTIHSYPTMAEANKYAAGVWKRAHAPQALLRLLAHYHRRRLG